MVFDLRAPTTRIARMAVATLAAVALSAPASGQTARVTIVGAPESISEELRRLLPEEPQPETLFEARRQADRASAIVARLVESEGYFAATVTPEAAEGPPISRQVKVELGPLFILNASRLSFPDGPPDGETLERLNALLLPLATGVPARAQPIIDAGDAMLRLMREAGYPDAAMDPVDALADARAQTLDLTFVLRPGPRTTFGDIEVSGLDRTRRDFIDRLAPWGDDNRYSPIRLEELRTRLSATGLFDSVSVQLGEPATGDGSSPQSRSPQSRPVRIELVEGPRRTVAFGASASTSEGVGVDAEWARRNLTGRGDTLTARAKVATLESTLNVGYRRPHVGRYGRNLLADGGLERFETDAFDQSGGRVSAAIEDQVTPRLRGSLGVETAYASIADSRARQLGLDRRDVWLVGGAVSAEYTGVRDVLDPTNGVRARVSIEPGFTWGESQIAFTRISSEASAYGDVGSPNLVGALRGRIGSILGANGAPPDRLFFAGGGGSVRGYEYQSLSPRDSLGALIGGRSLVEASAELRWRLNDRVGLVGFADAGAAGAGSEPSFEDMRAGAGLGFRYYAGFGPLRFDIALPLDKREGDADFQVYLSIGQAF